MIVYGVKFKNVKSTAYILHHFAVGVFFRIRSDQFLSLVKCSLALF